MPQADPKSSSGQEQQQTAQTVPYPSPYPQQFEDDTIDFYELWITLWNRKWLVIAVTVVAALGSIVYALQLQVIYKAEALLLPPKKKDIQSLNSFGPQLLGNERLTRIDKKDVTGPAADAVFSKFKQNLNSRTLHKKFIQEKGLMEFLAPDKTAETRDEDIYKGFAKLIKLGEKNGSTSLSIEMHDAEIAAQWVNDLIEFIDKETIAMLVEDLRNSIANEIRFIEYTISSKRQMVKQRKQDQVKEIETKIESKRKMAGIRRRDKIVRYTEASQTAKILGIMTGLAQQTKIVETSRGIIQQPLKSEEKTSGASIAQMNVDIATATTPLFFMGYDALMSELHILKSRINDDPFIPGLRDLEEQLNLLDATKSEDPYIEGLRDLQERLALLRSIKFDKEKVKALHIDQAAYPPKSAIKPNRRSIVSLSTVAGLFSGIFLTFFIEFVQKQRKKHSE